MASKKVVQEGKARRPARASTAGNLIGADMDLSTITPDQEIDLGEFGIQAFSGNFLIEEAGVEDTENGRRWFIKARPVDNDEVEAELPNGQVMDGGFLTHVDRPELVKYGINGLKPYFKAVFGKSTGALDSLKGEMFYATASEDDSGFVKVKKVKAARK